MRRYLIADDNRDFADNLAEILREEGDVEVVVAADGHDAVEQLRRGSFDALLTDMKMPRMGGARLVHEARALDPSLPAIVTTAYSKDVDLELALANGILAVLPKPVPIPRLLEILSRARRGGFVVVVEEDGPLRENLAEALAARGFTAVSAGSLLELDRIGNVRPFTAIVDLRIAGCADGEALLDLVERFPSIEPIVVSAFDEAIQAARGRTVIERPFDSAALLDCVESLYARSR